MRGQVVQSPMLLSGGKVLDGHVFCLVTSILVSTQAKVTAVLIVFICLFLEIGFHRRGQSHLGSELTIFSLATPHVSQAFWHFLCSTRSWAMLLIHQHVSVSEYKYLPSLGTS